MIMLKKMLLSLTFLLVLLVNAQAQEDNAITRYFDKYVEDERFTVVYVSEYMFGMIANIGEEGEEEAKVLQDIFSGLKELHVLTTSEGNGHDLYKEATSMIDTKDYKMLMKVRDGDENIQFLLRENKDKVIEELLLLVGGEDNFVMVSLVGVIDLSKIGKLSGAVDMQGLEHLDKLDNGGDEE